MAALGGELAAEASWAELRRIVLQKARRGGSPNAEDDAQAALALLFRDRGRRSQNAPFLAWGKKAGKWRLADARRARYRDSHSLDERVGLQRGGNVEWLRSRYRSPLAQLLATELRTRVERLLAVLTPEDERLVRLLYWDGLLMREAGTRMGRCESWVCQRHSRILAQLRQEMEA